MDEKQAVNQIAKSMIAEMHKGSTLDGSVDTPNVSRAIVEAIQNASPEFFNVEGTIKEWYRSEYWKYHFDLISKAKDLAIKAMQGKQ